MLTHTPILNAKLGKHNADTYTFDIRPEDDIEGNRDIWDDV